MCSDSRKPLARPSLCTPCVLGVDRPRNPLAVNVNVRPDSLSHLLNGTGGQVDGTVLRHRLNEATASVVSGWVRTLHQLTQCIRIWQARGLVDVLLRNDVLTSVNNTGRFVLSTPTRVPARGEHPRVRRTTRTAHVVLVVIPDDLVAGGIRNVGTGCVSVQVPE